MTQAPIDSEHTFFIMNLVKVYVNQIQSALYNDDSAEILNCEEVTETADTLDWKGNMQAVIAAIEAHIASGALPKPFEENHLPKLAASRGHELEPAKRASGVKGFYYLFETASGTYLQNQAASDDGISFTEWQAYTHLLNLPPIDTPS